MHDLAPARTDAPPAARSAAPPRWTRVLFALSLPLLVLAPLAAHWARGETLAHFDTMALYAPVRGLVEDALRGFRLPLWNPYSAAGVPLLADAVHGVLHPLSLLVAWVGSGASIELLIGGHAVLAGVGAALLAHELGASRAGALAAASTYGLSGFVLSMSGNLVFLAGAGGLPLALAGLRRFAARPGPASLAYGSAGVALLALGGDLQAVIVAGVVAVPLAWEAAGWRGAARAALAGSLGLLLAGIQLVPTAFHLPRSDRADEQWQRTPAVWALALRRIPELVLPGLCRGPDPHGDAVFGWLVGPEGWPAWNGPFPFATSVFIGVVPVALAVAGVASGRRGRVLGALALACLWVAAGPALGADALAARMPIWSAFRYPEKMVGPTTLLVAVLASLGVDAVVRARSSGARFAFTALGLATGAVAASSALAAALPGSLAEELRGRVLRGGVHAMAAVLAVAAWLVLRSRVPEWAGGLLLAAIVWCGMAAASPQALRPGSAAARLSAPGPQLVADAPGPRVLSPFQHVPIGSRPGLDRLDSAAESASALGEPAYNVRARLDSLNEITALVPARLVHTVRALGSRWPLGARRYGLTHVLVDVPLAEDQAADRAMAIRGATLVERRPAGAEVWAVPHRPWAAFAPAVRLVPDERAAATALADVFMEPEGVTIVESPYALEAAPGRVLNVSRWTESLRIEAEADGPATLVVADAFWPGWEATLDGIPVTIYPSDVLVRAVRWPPGRHVLEMVYRPPEVVVGWVVTGLGLAVLLVAMLRLHAAPRRVRVSRR